MTSLIYNVLPVPPRPVASISPESTVKQCVDKMTELNIGALIVLDGQKNMLGLVSERDVLRECLHKGLNPDTTKVADIVHQKVTILTPKDHIEKAMQVMIETRRRHILIQENEQIVAIISIGDLLFHLLEDKARVIEQLEQYIHS